MDEWHVGDPEDWGDSVGVPDIPYMGYINNGDEDERPPQRNPRNDSSRADILGDEAWKLYMDFKDTEALAKINEALALNYRHAKNWNTKAIILESLKRFDESEECYNKSLELSFENLVSDNKARMLHDWAVQLLEESRTLPDGRDTLKKADDVIIRAMTALPGDKSEENIKKYLDLRDIIMFSIDYENRYNMNLEKIKKCGKDKLFTITGMKFHKADIPLAPGIPLKLVKEPDNEFDGDAIAVYAEDKKIGYVANSKNTVFEMTSSASDLKDKIDDVAKATYLFYLERYPEIHFTIGKITNRGD